MLGAICGAVAYLFREQLTPIPFGGVPKYQREGTLINGRRAEKSTLEFITDRHPDDSDRLAFIVERPGGDCILIGTREPNYPQVEYSDTTGAPDGDAAVRTYKITHTDIKSGLPLVL